MWIQGAVEWTVLQAESGRCDTLGGPILSCCRVNRLREARTLHLLHHGLLIVTSGLNRRCLEWLTTNGEPICQHMLNFRNPAGKLVSSHGLLWIGQVARQAATTVFVADFDATVSETGSDERVSDLLSDLLIVSAGTLMGNLTNRTLRASISRRGRSTGWRLL